MFGWCRSLVLAGLCLWLVLLIACRDSCPNLAFFSNLHSYLPSLVLSQDEVGWFHSQKLGFVTIRVSDFKAANILGYLPCRTTVQT